MSAIFFLLRPNRFRRDKELKRDPYPASFDADTPCKPTTNVFFVKTHKTGSTTLQSIINRFGYNRNLSFAFRRQDPRGHVSFRDFSKASPREMFLPPIHDAITCTYVGYNMSTVHIAYNRQTAATYMAEGTKYISLLRDPVTQWLSAYKFFRLHKLPRDHKMETLLDKKNGYWRQNLYSRNLQSLDLGLKVNQFEDMASIQKRLLILEYELDLVLITEFFDESLILLKKEFCWSFEDILYISKNIHVESLNVSSTLEKKIRDFNSADMILYQFFREIFIDKLAKYGASFESDLRKFRQMREEYQEDCTKNTVERTKVRTFEYQKKDDTSEKCRLLVAESLFPEIRERQSHDDC